MKWIPESGVFWPSLGAWAIRGVFCALPSFVWAVGQYGQPWQIAEMAAGVASYVVAFAWVTAVPMYRERVHAGDLGWSLRAAANTRAALAPLMFFGPDLWLGWFSTEAIKWIVRFATGSAMSGGGVGWTYATTLVQGALVSATMLLLAFVIWGVRVGLKKGGLKPRPTFQGTS